MPRTGRPDRGHRHPHDPPPVSRRGPTFVTLEVLAQQSVDSLGALDRDAVRRAGDVHVPSPGDAGGASARPTDGGARRSPAALTTSAGKPASSAGRGVAS